MTDETSTEETAPKSEPSSWEIIDKFALEATPKLFEWFRWVLTLSALKFAAEKSSSSVLVLVVAGSQLLLFYYYLAYFSQLKIFKPRTVRLRRLHISVSGIASGLIGYGTYELVKYLVQIVSGKP